MQATLRLFVAAIILSPNMASAVDCELSTDGIRKYEHRLLNATTTEAQLQSLHCLLEIQEKADADTRYLANAYLRVLLGGPMVKEVPANPKHKEMAQMLEKLSLSGDMTVQKFAAGDWQFYKLFCEEGDVQHCALMIPDEERVRKASPLLAAGSILHLRQAYLSLAGAQKEQVAERIKNLYSSIPKSAKIQRRFIEKVYAELFGTQIPLSLWS